VPKARYYAANQANAKIQKTTHNTKGKQSLYAHVSNWNIFKEKARRNETMRHRITEGTPLWVRGGGGKHD